MADALAELRDEKDNIKSIEVSISPLEPNKVTDKEGVNDEHMQKETVFNDVVSSLEMLIQTEEGTDKRETKKSASNPPKK